MASSRPARVRFFETHIDVIDLLVFGLYWDTASWSSDMRQRPCAKNILDGTPGKRQYAELRVLGPPKPRLSFPPRQKQYSPGAVLAFCFYGCDRSVISMVNGVLAMRLFRCVVLSTFAFISPALTFAQQSLVQPLIVEPLDEAKLTVLKGNTHPLAQLRYDQGAAPASLPMNRMLLVLKRSAAQETVLRKLLDDQQDKASPNYHQWLTPEDFGKQFGPTDNDIQTIVTWLQSHGFLIGQVSKGRTVIEFSGTAGQVQEALHTSIHKYLVNGEEHWANASDPQIPAALASAIVGIDSLHNFQKKAQNVYAGTYSKLTKRLIPANPDFTGCTVFQGCYGVGPYDFATIYDVLPLWTAGINGAGQTIAIVGRTDINPQDAVDFWNLFGLDGTHAPQPTLTVTVNGLDPGFNGDEPEADIDTQWSGAVAPGATISFVTSASTEATDGIDLSAIYIVDNNLAPVMSESYGECELGLGTAGNQFYSLLWEQAAAQGISAFVSTGDAGAAGCDNPGGPAQYGLNVNGLGSTPFNAAVGGTDFHEYNNWSSYWNPTDAPITQESAKGYIPESTWDDSCTNPLLQTLNWGTTAEAVCNNPQAPQNGLINSEGGSGGKSSCVVNGQQLGTCTQGYAKPSWQSGAGIPNDSLRDLPDVSLFASNGFVGSLYVICQSDASGTCNLNALQGYGGTSVASPAFAGIMALVNQKMGGPQGVPGFVLYKLAASKPTSFHDTATGSTIAMPCLAGSPNCTVNTSGHQFGVLSGYATGTGYDLATGLGSVDANSLVNNWSSVTFTATTTNLTLDSGAAVNITHGQPVNVNIGVSPAAATGDVSLLVSTGSGTTTGQAIDGFKLSGGSFSGTTSLLPGGTYNVIAHYAGNGTDGGSYSTPPISVTVAKENSTPVITLPTFSLSTGEETSANVTSVPYGTPYILRVDVANAAGTLCSPSPFGEVACPSGSLALLDNGTAIAPGTYTLDSEGSTENQQLQFTQLPAGTHTLKATYAGDNSFKSSSGTDAITVTQAVTTASVSVPASAQVNTVFTANASVLTQSLGPAPGGTITFLANGAPITGSVSYIGNAGAFNAPAYLNASLTVEFSTGGNRVITAQYNGDGNYAASTSPAVTVSVTYPQPGVTLTPTTQTVAAGSPATLTVLVDTANKTTAPTGTVSFINSSMGGTIPGTPIYTQTTDGSGNVEMKAVLTYTPGSSDTVSAGYSGDTNYPAANTNSVQVVVTGNDFTLAVSPSSASVTPGQTATLSASVGFQASTAPVTFATSPCTGLPTETTCSVSPSTEPGSWAGTLTIITTAPHQVAANRSSGSSARGIWAASFAVTFAGIFLIGGSKKRRRWSSLLSLLAFTVLLTLPACGGGGTGGGGGGGGGHTDPGTPAGTYPIVLTATSGSITHTANFTLVVQ
jgi:Pro-kumamolisin, activation domain/Bacterial Ig-like domain (group 3)